MFGIAEIDAGQLLALMEGERDNFRLVDVRSTNEMAYGMLPDAEALPMHLIPVRLDELRTDRKLVFYCQTGARSAQVCAYLQQQGIDDVINLRGGIVDWHRCGYAIETPRISGFAGTCFEAWRNSRARCAPDFPVFRCFRPGH